jgi:hypothetical protein
MTNGQKVRILKKMDMAYLKVLYKYSLRSTEENCKKNRISG